MAIKRHEIVLRRTAVREFTDRIEPREAFWNRYDKMISDGTTVITFYGAGGLGKTSLTNELMNEIDLKNLSHVKYLYHDFINGLDMRTILRHWKNSLETFGCEFPLFETGDFYLSLKQGAKDVDAPQMKSWLQKNKWMTAVKDKLEFGNYFVDNVMPGVNAAAAIENFSSEALSIFPSVKTVAALFKVVDKIMGEREIKNRLETHSEIREQLKQKFEARNSAELYEFLPLLFAQDVRDWQQSSNEKLIIFLDTYELLTGGVNDGEQLNENNLYRDWWIRDETAGHEGLIFTIPNVLWVLSGRNKIRWSGELEEELEQHLLERLSYDDSNHFLKTAEIEDQNLRDGIIKLTDGYPLYLDICVDTYERLLALGKTPKLDDFGQNREHIINRLMRYMNDEIRQIVQCLCLLGTWTDDMAHDIVIGYDINTYIKVKKLSFIQQRFITLDDEEVEIFSFDRTLQKFIIESLKDNKNLRMLIDEIEEAVNKYFGEFIDKIEYVDDAAFSFYLKLWSDFIIKLVDDGNQLKEQYEEYLIALIHNLISCCQVTTVEEILNNFLNKALELNDENNMIYAYFESEMAEIKHAQGKYNEEFNYRQSVYDKASDLLGGENSVTIEAKSKLADSFYELGNYYEALRLKEEVLVYHHKTSGDENDNTMDTKHDLAGILLNLGRYDEARQIYEQVLHFRQRALGNKDAATLEAEANLALVRSEQGELLEISKKIYGETIVSTFSELGLYKKIRKIQEEMLEIDIKTYGEDHPNTLIDMGNLANTLDDLRQYDKALKLQEHVLQLRKDILGNEHPDTILTMHNLAITLDHLERHEEALSIQEKALQLRKDILGENHPDTISTMNNLAVTLKDLKRYEEALSIQEKVLELSKKVLGEDHPDTIRAMDKVANTLQELKRYKEALPIREKTIELQKKVFGEENINTLNSMFKFEYMLIDLKRREEELSIEESIFELNKKIHDKEDPDIIETMNALAETLHNLSENEEILPILKETLNTLIRAYDEEHDIDEELDPILPILYTLIAVAEMLNNLGQCDKSKIYADRTLKLGKKFLEDDEDKLEGLIAWYNNFLEKYNNNDSDYEDGVMDEDDKNGYNIEEVIDESESISLRRGQKVQLSANTILVSYDCQFTSDIELDTSAFMLDNTGKVSSDDDFIFYNNPKHISNCIEYLEDGKFEIDLSKVPVEVNKIAIALTIDGKENFSQIDDTIVRLIDIVESKELINFDFGDNLKKETAVVIGEIYDHKGQWKFNAVGAGFNGGLAALCRHFGVGIE